MKYQTQQNLIDPEAPTSALEFDFEDHDTSEIPDDAYVIGADGNTIERPNVAAPGESHEGPHRWAKPAAFTLGALFVVLTIWNLSRLIQGPPAPPKPSPFQAKQALYLGVMKIDAYKRVHGVSPETLTAAGLPEGEAYAYRRVNPSRYVLSFRNGGARLEYDSIEPKERFFGSPKEMLTMGDSK